MKSFPTKELPLHQDPRNINWSLVDQFENIDMFTDEQDYKGPLLYVWDPVNCQFLGHLEKTARIHNIATNRLRQIINPYWDNFDWEVEPPVSLKQLYKQRVEWIRDKYSYVMLMYSGGSDSHQILRTFIDNNIKLDEVAMNVYFDGGVLQAKHEQIYNQLKNLYSGRITIQKHFPDPSNERKLYEQYQYRDYDNDIHDNYTSKLRIKINTSHFNGKVGRIHGYEKAQVHRSAFKTYIVLTGLLRHGIDSNVMKTIDPQYDDIPFFSVPKILCKEAHLIKKNWDGQSGSAPLEIYNSVCRDPFLDHSSWVKQARIPQKVVNEFTTTKRILTLHGKSPQYTYNVAKAAAWKIVSELHSFNEATDMMYQLFEADKDLWDIYCYNVLNTLEQSSLYAPSNRNDPERTASHGKQNLLGRFKVVQI